MKDFGSRLGDFQEAEEPAMDLENLNRQNFLRQTDSGVTEAPQDDDEIRCIQKVMQVGSATTLGCTNVQKVFRFIPHPNSPFFVSKDFIKWKKIAKNKGWVEVLFWELSAQRYVALAYPTTTLFKISRFFLNGCGEVNFFFVLNNEGRVRCVKMR